jgi:hypothetical protein
MKYFRYVYHVFFPSGLFLMKEILRVRFASRISYVLTIPYVKKK